MHLGDLWKKIHPSPEYSPKSHILNSPRAIDRVYHRAIEIIHVAKIIVQTVETFIHKLYYEPQIITAKIIMRATTKVLIILNNYHHRAYNTTHKFSPCESP